MGEKKKDKKAKKEKKEKQEKKVVVVEYNVSMHCNACERTVSKAIFKIKGVDKFITDMAKNKVIVIGKINPQKVLKKLKKKTGKRVEIVNKKEDDSNDEDEGQVVLGGLWNPTMMSTTLSCCDESAYFMFSDENANACSIM